MRTMFQLTVVVGSFLVQWSLTPPARVVAQTDAARRYSEPAATPDSSELPRLAQESPLGGDSAPASRRWPPIAQREVLPNQRTDSGTESFAGSQPADPEELPVQTTPPFSAADPVKPLGAPGSGSLIGDAADSRADRSSQPANAKDWVTRLLTPPQTGGLSGEPLTLDEAIQGSVGRLRQQEVVTAYWHLAVAVAKYNAAAMAQTAGHSDAEIERLANKLEAVRAQHRLAEVLQFPEGQLPLPASQPHVGSYNTRYDEIYSGRFHRGAWQLHQTLPLLYEIVKVRSDALGQTQTGTAAFRAAASGFIDVVGEYNLAITDYALLAAGDSLSGRDLVPLLIRADRQQEQTTAAGFGRSAAPPQGRRRLASVPPAGSVSSGSPAGLGHRGQPLDTQSDSPNGQWRQRESQSLDVR